MSPPDLEILPINYISRCPSLAVASIWDVNPFDQPAVEEGKILALKFLNDKK